MIIWTGLRTFMLLCYHHSPWIHRSCFSHELISHTARPRSRRGEFNARVRDCLARNGPPWHPDRYCACCMHMPVSSCSAFAGFGAWMYLETDEYGIRMYRIRNHGGDCSVPLGATIRNGQSFFCGRHNSKITAALISRCRAIDCAVGR